MIDLFKQEIYQKQLCDVAKCLPENDISILVTGATGLIGSFLVDTLLFANKFLHRNYIIYALGRSRGKLSRRFSYASETDGLHFIVADVCEPLDANLRFDYIVHGASNADPKSYALHPSETLLTNILGTRSVLDFSKANPQTRLLVTSTFEVYGDAGKNGSITEDSTGIIDFHVLRNSYPASKVCAELLCQCYIEQFAVDCVIVRLGGVYGPTMTSSDSKAQAQFIRKAISGDDIVLKSKGEQIRSYCYVADAVNAIFTVLFYGQKGEAYNVADDSSIISIADFANVVANIGGVKVISDIPDEDEAKGFSKPVNVILNSDKLKSLGWKPLYGLNNSLHDTIRCLKNL